jgi:hypothetical protein
MKKLIMVFTVIICLFGSTIFVQAQNSDIGPNSVVGVGSDYAITPEEKAYIQNQTFSGVQVPTEILDELAEARHNEDFTRIEELNELILKNYSEGVRVVGTSEYQRPDEMPLPDLNYSYSGFETDWLDNDVLVDTGATSNYQRRNLDLKYGDDGNMYLAHSLNQAGYRGIRVFRSTNDGQNWSYIGGIFYPSVNRYIMTLSMQVDIRGTINDSLRVIVYYTHSAGTNNDGANLAFFSLNPATSNYLIKSIDAPPSGREFNYVSAFSDGQYWGSATWIGCIVGDYSNDADSTYNINFYRSTNWGDTHTSVSLPFGNALWVDRFPNASLLPGSDTGSDSVMIVTERVFTGYSAIRAFVTKWSTLSTDYRTIFLAGTTSDTYERPVVAVKQARRSDPKDIIVTCTKDGLAVYHSSANGGVTWGLDYILDQRSQDPKTTAWTHVSSDSMGTAGDFVAIFSNSSLDSINVRRGTNGSLGSTTYKVNDQTLTGTNPPVCAIYRDGANINYSAITYWAWGPNGVYYDGENLLTGIQNVSEPISDYELSQNYPNPFNPATMIKFNIPEASNVTLKIYDVLGNEVSNILNGQLDAGQYEYNYNAQNLSSGVYFYKIEAVPSNGEKSFVQTKKMILMK